MTSAKQLWYLLLWATSYRKWLAPSWRGHNCLVNPNGKAWRNEYMAVHRTSDDKVLQAVRLLADKLKDANPAEEIDMYVESLQYDHQHQGGQNCRVATI